MRRLLRIDYRSLISTISLPRGYIPIRLRIDYRSLISTIIRFHSLRGLWLRIDYRSLISTIAFRINVLDF